MSDEERPADDKRVTLATTNNETYHGSIVALTNGGVWMRVSAGKRLFIPYHRIHQMTIVDDGG